MVLTPTHIPAHARIEGLVQTPADLEVEGQLDGRIHIGGALTVSVNATCRADVRARSARVLGVIIGNIVCSESIEVGAGAKVVGDIRAPDIAIDSAAEIDGRVDLLAPEPDSAGLARASLEQRGPPILRPIPPGQARVPEFDDEPTRQHARQLPEVDSE